jgi:nucleotide-binding universal stress UspA family protein
LSQSKGKFSKILVAIDGSQPSMDAEYYAVAIAKKENTSELIALHVMRIRRREHLAIIW